MSSHLSHSGGFSLSDSEAEALLNSAAEVAKLAYCPYSDFAVGAALLLGSGEVITGCNVENASYGLTLCAERSALVQAIAQGIHPHEMKALAVWAKKSKGHHITPCGACRQVIQELMPSQAIVITTANPGKPSGTEPISTWRVSGLLPDAFSL